MKKILFMFVGILCSLVTMAAEQTASFSLVSFTAGNPASITSSDNTDVSLSIGRSDNTSNVSADSKSRGFRVQGSRFFTITVPSGKYITKVVFTSNSQGNPSKNDGEGNVGIWSVTGESSKWKLGGKAESYTWSNGGSNLSNPMTFEQTGDGDAYIAAVKVYYDNAPTLEDKAPTIKTQPTNATTVTDVATTLSVAADGTPAPAYKWYSCDDAEKTNAQPIDGATSSSYSFTTSTAGTYYFYAEAENKAGKATSNVVTVTVNQAYVMTFSKGETGAIGTVNPAIRTNGELKVTTPKYNNALFVEGKTFVAWTDGENNYLPNTEYTLSSNVTVTPVFENNTIALDKLAAETTVNFIKSTSIAATYQSSNQNAVVEQLTEGGKTIDVALIVKNGKFDLQPAGPRAQTNENTVVSIPVTKGAVVVIDIYDNKADGERTYTATINDESVEPYLAAENGKQRVMTYTYNGEADYIDYVVGAGNMYAYRIDVTYPTQGGISTKPTTIFSMKTKATSDQYTGSSTGFAQMTDEQVTVTGGSASVGGVTSKKFIGSKNGYQFCVVSNSLAFYITLDEALAVGDILSFDGIEGNEISFTSNATRATDIATTNFTYTIKEDDGLAGGTELYLWRATSNTTYFNNFKITRPATVATPTIGKNGYSTYCSDYAFTVTGATAYKATMDGETVTLVEIEGAVPAGEGVVLKGDEGATATLLYAASAPAVEGNILKGVNSETTEFAAGANYVLASNGTKTAFVKMADGKTVADMMNKAYLNVTSAGAKPVIFIDDDDATAADVVEAAQENVVSVKKFFKNGQLLIETANGLVNAAGAQVK